MTMDDFPLLQWNITGLETRERGKKKKAKEGGENSEVVKGW